jgi:cytochrome P450
MAVIHVNTFKEAGDTLRVADLRQALYDEGAILMAKVLVNLHGEEHRQRRNVESKVLRRDYFRWYEDNVFPQTLAETFRPFLVRGKADVVDFGFRVMMNLTADFSGVDRPKRSAEETEQLLRILRTFGKAATLGQATGDKEAIRAEIRAALEEFDLTFMKPSLARRRALLARFAAGEIREEELPRDVLTELLRNEAEHPLSHDVLMKEIGFFLLAGAFTSIHSLTHSVHELLGWMAEHPDDAGRIRTDPLFLQRCVHESMRLHPSSPTAGRKPTCPMHLPGGEAATPDDYVSVDLLTANKDVKVFGADAAGYNPHREVPRGAQPYGLSFGMGAHACIGLNMAAGALPRPDTDPRTHQYGTVVLIIKALLDADARPDPDDPAIVDTSNIRRNWARYPVLLGRR